ncbi:hypothetical protein [Paenibacillus hamazuiensis]|uniref:hypothetical protein n=1 Tax=Paenibacillus hamazuiensis TaxID=2936508 RepID=UPI00200F0F4B|nr:hypothetical protein [Paenibacillus hamazuiensis]
MTQEEQHQMRERHGVDNAEKAIQMVKYAEMEVKQAREKSDPKRLQSALGKLQNAQHMADDAQAQLEEFDNLHHHQELEQVQQQTHQSLQDAGIALEEALQPKQVR